LRALITADYDLVPDDPLRYRVAFIEAFRKWGIYPRDVRTLSVDSLRWHPPDGGVCLFRREGEEGAGRRPARREVASVRDTVQRLRRSLAGWQPGAKRDEAFEDIKQAQRFLNRYLFRLYSEDAQPRALGDLLREGLRACADEPLGRRSQLSVANLRPARRVGQSGECRREMVLGVVRSTLVPVDPDRKEGPGFRFRGGITFIAGMDDWSIRYCIWKRLGNRSRQDRQREYAQHGEQYGFGA